MRILVTGGAGFIGSNFVYYLLEHHPDDEVIVLDALTYAGDLETLQPLFDEPRFQFVRGNISDRNDVYGIVGDGSIEVIVNFAAESHVDRSIEDPGIFVETNVLGTQVLLDAAADYGIQRFHQVSTDEVYGDLPLDDPDAFFTEDTPLAPSSPYSASKASADLLTMAYSRTFGLPVSISRCSNNYGPFQFPEKLIPLVITHALRDEPIPVYGTGANVRDWLFVEDHCAGIDQILREGRPGCIYNLGGHNEHTNLEIVQMILARLGKPESLIAYVKDRPGHDLRYAIDPARVQADLGWEPETAFEEGIAATIDWYLANRRWWENVLSGEYRTFDELAGTAV